MIISKSAILMGREVANPLTPQLTQNLDMLVECLNKFADFYQKPLKVASGYRPAQFNAAAGGAKKSNHMLCLACDFVDLGSALDSYCVANQDILEKCGLYLEHPKWTKGWCHLQCVKPSSGKRIFVPSVQEPIKSKLDELFITLEV